MVLVVVNSTITFSTSINISRSLFLSLFLSLSLFLFLSNDFLRRNKLRLDSNGDIRVKVYLT